MEDNQPLLYRNATEIGEAIGKSRREVNRLVREEGLPAWQERPPTGPWYALPEDIREWLKKRSREFMQQ